MPFHVPQPYLSLSPGPTHHPSGKCALPAGVFARVLSPTPQEVTPKINEFLLIWPYFLAPLIKPLKSHEPVLLSRDEIRFLPRQAQHIPSWVALAFKPHFGPGSLEGGGGGS